MKGSTSCAMCVEGQYQQREAQAECIMCTSGTYQTKEFVDLMECETGLYDNKTGIPLAKLSDGQLVNRPSSACVEICRSLKPPGCDFDCQESRSPECMKTVESLTVHANTDAEETIRIEKLLKAWKDFPNGGLAGDPKACAYCPKGYFQPEQGAVMCLECPEGKYTSCDGRRECRLCEAGRTSNPRVGGVECIAETVATLLPVIREDGHVYGGDHPNNNMSRMCVTWEMDKEAIDKQETLTGAKHGSIEHVFGPLD